jgi:hypothetical protein
VDSPRLVGDRTDAIIDRELFSAFWGVRNCLASLEMRFQSSLQPQLETSEKTVKFPMQALAGEGFLLGYSDG